MSQAHRMGLGEVTAQQLRPCSYSLLSMSGPWGQRLPAPLLLRDSTSLSSCPLFSGALQTLHFVSSWKLASSPAFVNLCLPSYTIAAQWVLKG